MVGPNFLFIGLVVALFVQVAIGTRRADIGEHCDRRTKCDEHLVCEDGECKIGKLGFCTDNRDACADGLSCVGPDDRSRCNTLMGPGGACETDPYWVCKPGLSCEENVCKIPEGGKCAKTSQCASGLECTGKRRSKRCQAPVTITIVGPGEACGRGSNARCSSGSTCQGNICKLNERSACTDFPDQCIRGTICVGRPNLKRCKKPMRVGEKCGTDPFWVCADKLVCEDDRCKLPAKSDCTKHPDQCVSGTHCTGRRKKICH